MTDFRPIACCNTIYKVIAKLLALKLKPILPHIIDRSQTAFVKDRRIGDGFLLAQELMYGYHIDSDISKCALKIDLQKAFDSVQWDFLIDALKILNCPPQFIQWVEACVCTPSYSISINGELEGFFPGARGLRQGDPLSPFLFLIAMDVLSSSLKKSIAEAPQFSYHWRCKKTKLTHICFADDLLVFCHGDPLSLEVISKGLLTFTKLSGLKPNNSKSSIFLSGIASDVKATMVQLVDFGIGVFPFKYLGLPLSSSRLKTNDFRTLIDRITSRVTSWTSNFLSFAGRLQLINTILIGMHSFWSSHLIFPLNVLKIISGILRNFLWSGNTLSHFGAKISWLNSCKPKEFGGLGIPNLLHLNRVANLRHIWHLVVNDRQSLWVEWAQANIIKHLSFWNIKKSSLSSWNWRRLLTFRGLARNFVKHHIGDGLNTSLWFDLWHPCGVLDTLIDRSVNSLHACWRDNAKVKCLIRRNDWRIPSLLAANPSGYFNNMPPIHSHKKDWISWTLSPTGTFSFKTTFHALLPPLIAFPWYHSLWFKNCIHRHSFVAWIAAHNRLSTRDRPGVPNGGNFLCPLCQNEHESHHHLFFSCSYSEEVWKWVQEQCGVYLGDTTLTSILDWTSKIWDPSNNSLFTTIFKLCLNGAVYFLWRERNHRVFVGNQTPARKLCSRLENCIRLKLLSFKFKDNRNSRRIAGAWNLPSTVMDIVS